MGFQMVAAATLLSLGLAAGAGADPLAEVAEAGAVFEETFNASDAEALSESFAVDAIALAPGWAAVHGREKIAGMYGAFFKAGFGGMRTEADSAVAVGDAAVIETFRNFAARTDENGVTGAEQGFKVLRVWRLGDDGTWRITHLSFNALPREN